MTRKQYLRLTVVLFVPLLAAGWLWGVYLERQEGGPFITCEEGGTYENCREVGWDGPLRESVWASHPAWFDIRRADEDWSKEQPYFSGSKRMFGPSTILSTVPHTGGPGSAEPTMAAMEGRVATVQLGIEKGELSLVTDSAIILACNSLRFLTKPDEFESECYGDDWSGQITFRIGAGDQERLSLLRGAVEKQFSEKSEGLFLFRVLFYPIFLYLYFALSALIWLIIRAARWVKAAS